MTQHALHCNFSFLHQRVRVPLPSCVRRWRFFVLEAMVLMGSLASWKCPHPADLHGAGRDRAPLQYQRQALEGGRCAPWAQPSPPSPWTTTGSRSRSCTSLACRAQVTRLRGRFFPREAPWRPLCSCLLTTSFADCHIERVEPERFCNGHVTSDISGVTLRATTPF